MILHSKPGEHYETDPGTADADRGDGSNVPDFQNTTAFTGQDARFAYKRAVSRLWEMCGQKWWDRNGDGWWTPLRPESRSWERPKAGATAMAEKRGHGIPVVESVSETTSPFRTSSEPPPKFSWVHAWGMMSWGKKAGKWGAGVEGLDSGKKSRNGSREPSYQ